MGKVPSKHKNILPFYSFDQAALFSCDHAPTYDVKLFGGIFALKTQFCIRLLFASLTKIPSDIVPPLSNNIAMNNEFHLNS